jgi:hypothetical protein
MIHLVNPENPVKVQAITMYLTRVEKNLTLWRKFYCCTDETLCYYLLTLRRGAEERDVCHGR